MENNVLKASEPLTADEIEVVLQWAAQAANQRELSITERAVRTKVFAEHCQITAEQFRRERLARHTATA